MTVEPDEAWEQFRDHATREVDGRTIYVVEWDRPLSLDELRDYYDQHVADDGAGAVQQASTVATTPQGDDLWSVADRQHLTYCVSDAFGAFKTRAVAEMARATRAWEAEAHVNFDYLPQHDATCDQFNQGVKFAVRPWTSSGACAFFPSGSASCTPRTLQINFADLDNPVRKLQQPLLNTVGVFRHELGHILGLRHEQVQAPNSGGCPESGSFRPVTTYDRASVMHYPQCGGLVDSDLSISDSDAAGIRILYGASLSPYDQHFVVGNVDSDQRLDIIQAVRGAGTLPICRYVGSGFSCTTPSATSYNWDTRQQVLTGDFNADGTTDVAQAFFRWGSIPTCLSGSNGGAWNCNNPAAPLIAHAGDDDETRFLVGRFDYPYGDDVIEINRSSNQVLTCLSTATSTAASWNCKTATTTFPAVASTEQEFLVGEVDDPWIAQFNDVISTHRGQSSLPVCHANGSGGWYCDNYAATVYNAGSSEQRFLTADIQGDQRTDVLQTFRGWHSIPTCTATANQYGTFAGWTCRNPAATIFDSGSHEQQFLAGDFDGDGRADVVQTWRGWSSLPVCLQSGTWVGNTYEPAWNCSNPSAVIRNSGDRQQRFVVADVDRDGRSDVIQIFPGWSEYPVCFSRGAVGNVSWDCQRMPATIQKPIEDRFLSARQMVDFATHSYKGISVIAVKDGVTVFSRSAGNATSANLATADTAWHLASVSKLFIGTAALIAADRNQLDVNGSAGLANPLPGMNLAQPTIAQFANHTAGVQRDPCTSETLGDPDMTLSFAMGGCLSKPANQLWLPAQPAIFYQYSNFGAAWVARQVELATGTDFAAFVRTNILNPLGMTRSGHSIMSMNGQTYAQGWLNLSTPSPFNGINPYPAGNLRASANDLAKFMIMWTSGGVGANGTRVLSQARVDYALTQQNPAVSGAGFFWHRMGTRSGRQLWGHNGELLASATCTVLTIDPVAREGVAIMVNGKCGDTPELFRAIEDRVYRAVQTL